MRIIHVSVAALLTVDGPGLGQNTFTLKKKLHQGIVLYDHSVNAIKMGNISTKKWKFIHQLVLFC